MLKFKKNHYTIEEVTLCGETVRFRAFRDLVYVEKPVNVEFQKMNLFVPESYYEGTSINGYDLLSAPVFMPNTVGGYMPGPADEPGANPFLQGKPNTIFRALQHGYVVASPAIRGRVQKGEDGHYNGKAPACVVDYKAAVRYLHFLADELPGDENKIITNGTSAGGALSSLMGSTLTTSRICRRSAQRMLGMMCLRPPVTARSSIWSTRTWRMSGSSAV